MSNDRKTNKKETVPRYTPYGVHRIQSLTHRLAIDFATVPLLWHLWKYATHNRLPHAHISYG